MKSKMDKSTIKSIGKFYKKVKKVPKYFIKGNRKNYDKKYKRFLWKVRRDKVL